VGAEVIASITEQCFHYLEAPPLRVTGHDIPYPPAKLEKHHLPDLDRILDAVDRVLDRPNSLTPTAGWSDDRGVPPSRPRRGLPEAEIVQWLVAQGDDVRLNQPIAEVETAKAIVELPSPFAGTVSALHAAAGDVVEVGSPLIAFEVEAPASTPGAASEPGSAGAGRAEPEPRCRTSSATALRRARRDARSAAPARARARRAQVTQTVAAQVCTMPRMTW
jgi:hypothetical protein